LFCLDWAGAIAAGANFLGWEGKRQARVMYLDGEMSADLFKERLEIIAKRYGGDLDLFAYNREVIGEDEMPPLNTDAGEAWLMREIAAVKPDVIFFDSIMCLTIGNMSEEDSWSRAQALMQKMSAKRIAQVWLHHTGHDASRSYGTKTREWKMTSVIMLTKMGDEEGRHSAAFQLEFTKAREKTPKNFKQFATRTVRSTQDGFAWEAAEKGKRVGGKTLIEIIRRAYVEAYHRLADNVAPSQGFDGRPVRKVSVNDIRDELVRRGFLERHGKELPSTERSNLRRAKAELLKAGAGFYEEDGLLWSA
jgi:hypothetical protein